MASPLESLTRVESHGGLAEDEEEETLYFTLELGSVDPSLIPRCTSIRLVGLETPTPFLQLGDSVFRGVHVASLGTELIFDDATPGSTSRSVRPFAQIERKLVLNPVILTPKTDPVAEPDPETSRDKETPGTALERGGAPARRAGRPRGRARGRPRATETQGPR